MRVQEISAVPWRRKGGSLLWQRQWRCICAAMYGYAMNTMSIDRALCAPSVLVTISTSVYMYKGHRHPSFTNIDKIRIRNRHEEIVSQFVIPLSSEKPHRWYIHICAYRMYSALNTKTEPILIENKFRRKSQWIAEISRFCVDMFEFLWQQVSNGSRRDFFLKEMWKWFWRNIWVIKMG